MRPFLAVLALTTVLAEPARAEPLEPAAVAAAVDSVVVVLPRWQGVRPGMAPRTADQRIAPEGSGVAVLPGGYIATNDHVLGDAVEVKVRLKDGRVLPARIAGRHKATDIALLKVDADLPVPAAADEPRVAEPVCAIGNPFGRGLSVSCGVVSATGRANAGFNAIEDFVQTDAAVNPGGSGGALVDGKGRLVGLVSAIFAAGSGQGGDTNIGVNFAAARRLVMRVAEDLVDDGKVTETDLGLKVGGLTAEQATKGGGAAVTQVAREGPALTAGIEAGDVITAVNGMAVFTPDQYRARAFLARPGEPMILTLRRGGKVRQATVIAAAK